MPSHPKPKIVSGLLTDVGRQRMGGPNQDDGIVVELPTGGLYAVADGMGGHAAGELASRVALEALVRHYTTERAPPPERLAEAVQAANTAVVRHAVGESVGMGTTLLAALIDGGALMLAHVGDSRAYLLRGGKLKQLTEDHSWVAEQVRLNFLAPEDALNHQWKNVVSNALGGEHRVRLELFGMPLRAGDRLLLCSDGLSGVIEEGALLRYLLRADSPEAVARLLVDAANEAGGPDNITVLVLDVHEDARLPRYRLPRRQQAGPEYADVLLSTWRGYSMSSYALLTTVYFTLLGVVLIQTYWLLILCTGVLIVASLLIHDFIERKRSAAEAKDTALSVRKAADTVNVDVDVEAMLSGGAVVREAPSTAGVPHPAQASVQATPTVTVQYATKASGHAAQAQKPHSRGSRHHGKNGGKAGNLDTHFDIRPPDLSDTALSDMALGDTALDSLDVAPPRLDEPSEEQERASAKLRSKA